MEERYESRIPDFAVCDAYASCTGGRRIETGYRAIVANCDEFITLRQSPDASAYGIQTIGLGEVVNVIGTEREGFVEVVYKGDCGQVTDADHGYVPTKYLHILDRYTGMEVKLAAEEHYNLNLFLSNFSEQGIEIYDEADMTEEWVFVQDAFYLDFVIRHTALNRPDKLEPGAYMLGDVRLKKQYLPEAVWRYFKKEIVDLDAALWNQTDHYYYWDQHAMPISGGFVCLDRVDFIGDCRFAVRFGIYGDGDAWTKEDCKRTPAEAAESYPLSRSGMAVIATDSESLTDRSDWRLEHWVLFAEM